MALLATGKPFQNLHKTNHPPLPSPLPKPTLISPRPLSFQRHASSTTFPTVSATTDLPKSPIFSFNIVHSSSLVPSPYNIVGFQSLRLVDCFYGTEYGLRASSQTRAEIGKLISQLEAQNPTPVPTEAPSLLRKCIYICIYAFFIYFLIL
jgi:hypothetical protein